MPRIFSLRHDVVRPASLLAPLCLALLAGLAPTGPARADDDGVVYVGSNVGSVEGMNSVLAFRRDHRGQLAALDEFPTGGTGVHPTADLTLANLGPFDSDQCLILDHDRDRVFYPNSGSDTIAVFDVRRDGRLEAVKGSPFPSGGINPVSVGLARDGLLVVANKDYDLGRGDFDPTQQGDYTTMRVTPHGKLIRVPFATVPAGAFDGVGPGRPTPTQALTSPDGRLAFDANFFGLHVRSFRILANGRLAPADSQTIPPPGGTNPLGLAIPLGLQVHPKLNVLYVGFVLDSAMGVYTYDTDGKLHFVRAVLNVGAGPCWFLSNAAGDRLFVSNNFANSIAVFDITQPLNPVKLATTTLPQGASNAAPFQIALDRGERFLHVVTQRATAAQDQLTANALIVLAVARDGTLIETAFVPIPSTTGDRPQGVAAR